MSSLTRGFPDSERYGLTFQARRAACSAAANIAEGSATRGPREFRRFVDISNGSLAELAYIMRLAFDPGLSSQPQYDAIRGLKGRASVVTWRLYKPLGRSRSPLHRGGTERIGPGRAAAPSGPIVE